MKDDLFLHSIMSPQRNTSPVDDDGDPTLHHSTSSQPPPSPLPPSTVEPAKRFRIVGGKVVVERNDVLKSEICGTIIPL